MLLQNLWEYCPLLTEKVVTTFDCQLLVQVKIIAKGALEG
jgi:hypothetical protein